MSRRALAITGVILIAIALWVALFYLVYFSVVVGPLTNVD
jgi:hypothetical protein